MGIARPILPSIEPAREPGISVLQEVEHLTVLAGEEIQPTNRFQETTTEMEKPTMRCTGMARGLFPLQEVDRLMRSDGGLPRTSLFLQTTMEMEKLTSPST